MEQISLCITNYNRTDMLLNSFKKVYDDERIKNIIISDDKSEIGVYWELQSVFEYMPKVKLYRNHVNVDCYRNKAIALELATTDYAILLDSDNQIDKTYIDKIYENEWDEKTSLMPSWAKPLFTYHEFAGLTISKENVAQYMDKPFFSTMLNCHNFFVNRHFYLECFDGSIEPNTADSIFINYKWFDKGGKMKVVDGMEYQHLVHENSHYKTNNHKTGDFYNIIENNLRNMK